MDDHTSDEGLYDFAPEPSPAPKAKLLKPVAEPGAPVVLPYRSVKEDKPKPTEPEAIKNSYLPLGLLVGGIVVELLSSIIWTHRVGATFAELALELTVGTGVLLGAMLIAARLRGIDLGKIPTAAFKLAAIAIAPAAVVEFMAPVTRFVPFGWALAWIVQFIAFFALLGALFDLEESDTWFCVFTMLFARIAFDLILKAIFRG